MERGAKVSGSRFYFLTGFGALLQLGVHAARGASSRPRTAHTLVIPPVLVRPEVMSGTGFLGAHADEIYRLEADDMYLVGTSEVPLAGYHADEILDLSDGPQRYAGWSSCFRREAGSYGKDTRGIIRVHQFDKVEAFVYCKPEDAEAEHQRLLGLERQMLAHDRGALPRDRHRRRRSRLVGGAQVRLRGVGADAGHLPRADVDVELHARSRRGGCPPATATRTASRRSRRRSTARWPPPAGWSPSWRTTSSRTAASASRRRWCPTSEGRCWHREH